MQYYGSERLTTDVDFVASKPIRRGTPISFRRGVIAGRSFKQDDVAVDWLVVPSDDDYAAVFAETLRTAVDSEEGYLIATPACLLLLKLISARPTDREDIIWLLQQPDLERTDLNRGRLERLAKRLLGQFAADQILRLASIAAWRKTQGADKDSEEE